MTIPDSLPADARLQALLAEASWLRRVARALVADDDAADDLSQDVLREAIDARPPLKGSRLRGWLRVVARRKATRLRMRESVAARAERAFAP